MEYPYFKGLEADRYSFYRVPKALVKADLFQKMSGDAKLLYAVLLDRMSLSIKNGWQDKHGNAYIICTIEEVMDSIHCARQKAVKLLDELEHEFRLIERRRQGLGKPNLLYVKDLYAGLSQSNYWKYENHTSGGMKNELPGVPKSNGSNTEKINKTDNSETDLIYPAELQEEEQYRRYFKKALELEILEQGYPADKAVLYEILELLVETVTSRKKFLRICGEDKPKEVVKSRLMKLDSSHIQYILECLKENSTQIRNIKQYLLATLYNAPVTVDSYYSAQIRHEFGWGGRVDHVVQPLQVALAVQDVELSYELPDAYFHIQTCDDGFDYTLYNKDFTEQDGGILETDRDKSVQEAMTELLAECKVMDAAELREQADTVAEQQAEVLKEKLAAERPAPEETLSFYVAECLEFTFAGEFHDHLTMEEALEAYDKIPSERMNADKCIGFCIEEDGGFVGMYELVVNDKVQRENINSINYFRDDKLVQQAISDMEKLMEARQKSKEQERSSTKSLFWMPCAV